MDKIRNEYIRRTAQVGQFVEKTRVARLRWYGHVRRKDDGYIGRKMLRMELPGKRKRGNHSIYLKEEPKLSLAHLCTCYYYISLHNNRETYVQSASTS